MHLFRAFFALLVAVPGSAVFAQAPPSPADLASRIQARYANVRDFTADFTLTQTSSILRRSDQDRGKVAIKKPGRMRWVYETGSKLQLVSDGTWIYTYIPADKQAMKAAFPKDDQASSALLLLTGRGDLGRDFTPVGAVEASGSEWRLTLKPKLRQVDFTTLTVAVDRATLALRGLVVNEEQGGVRQFVFTNLRENAGIADTTFVFKAPPGVEIR